jgi:hypothetical protein
MIWKVLKKIITAPLHIVEHSYKRAQQGFAYLTRRPGYVQYGPDAKPADGRAYVSPPFLLEARPTRSQQAQAEAEALSEAGDDEPHLDPDDWTPAFQQSSALKGFTTEYTYATNNQKAEPYPDFAAKVFNNIIDNIEENIKENKNVTALHRTRVKLSDGDNRWFSTTRFDKNLNNFTTREQLEKLLKNQFEGAMQDKIDEFCKRYENVDMVGVDAIAVNVHRNPSRRGGTFIKTPDTIKAKHGLINVDNSAKSNIKQEADNFCFKYAVCVGRFHDTLVKKLRRFQLSKPAVWKPYFHNLDWTGISFSTSMADIDTFEKNNPDIIVNVWTLEEDELHCEVARRSSRKVVEGQTHSINLLMLCAPGDDGGFLNHFTTILNIGTFRRTGKACKKFPCLTCTHLFSTAQLLQQHTDQGCHIAENGAVEVMPTINVPIQFKDVNNLKTRHHPYAMYADFESCLVPIDKQPDNFQNFAPKSATTVHDILSYCFYQMIWTEKNGDEVFKKVCKVRKPDQTIAEFGMQYMADIKDYTYDTYKYFCQNDLAVLTPKQKDQHWKIKNCCICKRPFNFMDKVRHHHHEHPTAKYIGPAHPHCNLTCNDWNFTNSVFFHNLKGNDAHHILLGSGKHVVDPANKDFGNLTQKALFDGTFTTISESAEKHKEIT